MFSNLPRSTKRKVHMPALRAGGAVLRKKAEANIKSVVSGESTGTLEKNIRVYSYKKYRGNYRVGVQVKRGAVNNKKIIKGQPVRVGLYAGVLEYRDGGKYSWIRKASREGKNEAVSDVTREFNRRMIEAIRDAKR